MWIVEWKKLRFFFNFLKNDFAHKKSICTVLLPKQLTPVIVALMVYNNVELHFIFAKLSFKLNLKFNLVESWDGFILNSSIHPSHPTRPEIPKSCQNQKKISAIGTKSRP